jgi:hypothetical protein
MNNTVSTRARVLVIATVVGLSAACGGSTPAPSDSAASTSATGATSAAPESRPAAVPVEVANATSFHLLDFVGWNNHDLDVFRRLHTADVKVDFAGAKTEGIDAHVQALEPMRPAFSLITNHRPTIAEGEWTCTVGVAPPKMKVVTVAKWRDGAISEEYLLANLLRPGAAKPAVSGSPMMSISNRNPELKRQVGAEPGWSCSLDRTPDGKMVISVAKAGGTAAEQMVFTQ